MNTTAHPIEATVLVVDDEPRICELLELTLHRMGLATRTAGTLTEAQGWLARASFDLCLTDMQLPDGNGLDLVRHIQQTSPDMPVAVITAYGSVGTAVEAMKLGAFDFAAKPVDLAALRQLVRSALAAGQTRPAGDDSDPDFIGHAPAMQAIRRTIQKVARSQAPVHITGESGTGKERVARLIHGSGPRAEQPFIPVNCGAIPAELVESEFFGHRKGSFTGATADKEGLFQAADGGTLFLDEVADLPLAMQVKLLRAVQERAVRPIGAPREIPVDVRLLSASHQDLRMAVRAGDFREDLYYRLNVIEIRVPTLRERLEDLPELARHTLARVAVRDGRMPPQLTDAALHALARHPFPGNVRELENILERAVALTEGPLIDAPDLDLPDAVGESPGGAPPIDQPLDAHLEAVERDALLRALEETGHNKTAAAERLGISFRAFRYRLKKLGLD